MNNKNAVKELLNCADTDYLKGTITEFWEAWITHPNTDDVKANDRADRLAVYKALIRFLDAVE